MSFLFELGDLAIYRFHVNSSGVLCNVGILVGGNRQKTTKSGGGGGC